MSFNKDLIPEYELENVIDRGATSVVYRARRSDGKVYALKILNEVAPQQAEAASLRFRQEVAAIARLNNPGLVRIEEAGTHNNLSYIAMELIEGESLEQTLRSGPIPDLKLLRIAKTVAGALAEVHRRGLIHRDLKPANILANTEATQVKIIDFGFAGRIDESPLEKIDDSVLGTFLYCPPEQSGMLKRTIDGRADLYALGATLFQCATGVPPYESKNTAELLQMHLSAPIPDAHATNPEIRPIFAKILTKLLAKDPDDRYQTAEGLLYDLENLPTLEAALDANQSPRLGTRDSQLTGGLELPLFGRAVEVAKMKEQWSQAKRGRGAIVQVEGEGGSGKTRLVRELMASARSEGALILQGKAQQAERMPLAVLRGAIEDYLLRALKYETTEKERIVSSIRTAAGDFGSIVRRLSRSLERILGDSREIPMLDPTSEQERFYEAISNFFVAIAQNLGPLILLIDDAQWIDDASLEVLTRIGAKVRLAGEATNEKLPLLLLSTARNDASSEEQRARYLERVGRQKATSIPLGPLDIEATDDLIAAHLGARKLEKKTVEELHSKASGNPFIIGEFVRSLLNSGLLQPTAGGSWILDRERLHAVHLAADVAQLLITRIESLNDDTKAMLSSAAVIGFEFEMELLVAATNLARDRVLRALEEGLRANLIERKSESAFQFVHDRVFEALFRRMSENKLRDVHDALALAMEKMPDDSPIYVYALARHYTSGHVDRHPQRVHDVAIRAGRLALESFSNDEAFQFLGSALTAGKIASLAPAQLGETHELLGTAALRTGHLDLTHNCLEQALRVATDAETRFRINSLTVTAHSHVGEYQKAWESLQETLGLLGAAFPKSIVVQVVTLLWYWLIFTLRSYTGWGFGSAQGAERERRMRLSSFHSSGNYVAYFLDPLKLAQVIIREAHNTHFLGVTGAHAKARAGYSVFLSLIFPIPKLIERIADGAVAMADQLGDLEAKAYCETYRAFAVEFAGDVLQARKISKRDLPDIIRYASAQDCAAISLQFPSSDFFLGHHRSSLESAEAYKDLIFRSGSATFIANLYGVLYANLSMSGRPTEAKKYRDLEAEIVNKYPQVKWPRAFFIGYTIMVLEDQEDFGPELETHIKDFIALNIIDYHVRAVYVAVMYCRMEQYFRTEGKAPEVRKQALRVFRKAVSKAGMPNAMTPIHTCHVVVGKAVLAFESGKVAVAFKLLDKADQIARQVDCRWGYFRITLQRARFLQATGDQERALIEAERALRLCQSEGWTNRAKYLRRDFALDSQGHSKIKEHGESGSHVGKSKRTFKLERYADALLQVSLASASKHDPHEQATAVLGELVKVLGAERAFLFLTENDQADLKLTAGRDTDGKELNELTAYSSTVVKKVHETNEAVVITGTDEAEFIGSQSAVVQNLRSIMAAPLTYQGKKMGVVYLDSRLARGIFTKDDVDVLVAMANHIAIAFENARAAKLELERQALEKDLQAKQAIQTILDNLDQGFMTFDAEGRIFPGVSKAAEELFGLPPAGKTLSELLRLEPKQSESIQRWLPMLYSNQISFESLVPLGPKVFAKHNQRYITLDYRPIYAQGEIEKLEKVILVATDKTNERALQAHAEAEANYAKMVVAVLKDRPRFFRIVDEIKSTFQDFISATPEAIELDSFKRAVHTMKGAAAIYYLIEVKTMIHNFETTFAEALNGTPEVPAGLSNRWDDLVSGAKRILAAMDDFLAKNKAVVGRPPENGAREILVKIPNLQKMAARLESQLGSQSPIVEQFYQDCVLEPVNRSFEQYEDVVTEVARRQGKKVTLSIQDSPIHIACDAYDGLFGSLIHAFRNAVDHGMESPSERERLGKPREGTIVVSFESVTANHGSLLRILIRDDGRGMDPEVIGRLAVERGLTTVEALAGMTNESIIQFVFAPGFSTRKTVTELSGRGVGLDAIQSEAKQMGGKAWAESVKGQGTTLIIEIPLVVRFTLALNPAERASA